MNIITILITYLKFGNAQANMTNVIPTEPAKARDINLLKSNKLQNIPTNIKIKYYTPICIHRYIHI